MRFELVTAKTDHIPQIALIWETCWHEAHAHIVPKALTDLRTSSDFLKRASSNITKTRVGVTASETLGFCMTQEDELYQIYVSPAARGTGLAQALIADGEAKIKAAGHASAWLACAVGNARAARFYEKSGWANSGVSTVDLDTSNGPFPLDIWRFEKSL